MTPIYIQDQWPSIDWYQYLRIWERLPANMRRVADLVGIEEAFLVRAVRGRILTRTDQQRQSLAVHRRFFAALALQDLVHEVPLNVVARRYGANRGMLQSLQGSAATFAGMVTVFCEKLGWTNMELLLSQFQSRLSFGVERELCDLVRISLLNAARARMLYNAGYHTMASVAAASPSEIENILHNAAPFVSGLKRGQETETEVRERSEARVIWVAGRRGLTEGMAAKLIVGEAKQLLQADVARLGIQWKPPETVENYDERGIQKEAINTRATDVGPSLPTARAVNSMQIGGDLTAVNKKEKISGKETKSVRSGVSAQGHCGQKIGTFCRPVDQEAGPSCGEGTEPVHPSANFVTPFENMKGKSATQRDCADSKVQSRIGSKKMADVTSKLKYEDRVTASEPLQKSRSGQAEKNPQRDSCGDSVGCCVVPSVTTAESKTAPRSRNKRRSPVPEIPEAQGKLKRKDTTELVIEEVAANTSSAQESRTTSPVMEGSVDSNLCNEMQSVSVELFSEPFEVDKPVKQEKPLAHDEVNDMLDSQALAAFSLSDTCLMECDVMVEGGVRKVSQHHVPVAETSSEKGVQEDIAKPQLSGVVTGESQDIIGEYDTQTRVTGEFQPERSFEFLPSFSSPVLHLPRRNAADDVASSSFSLRLSSSDGYSDLSSMVMAELVEKEAEVFDLLSESTTTVGINEANFTKIKNLKPTESSDPNHGESPAKKIPRNEKVRNVEVEGSKMPDSAMVPSTPPTEKQLAPEDFKTKTSATPLSTRKRPSPRRQPSSPDEGLSIIDVTGHEQVFSIFLNEWQSQTCFSFAVACEGLLKAPMIGGRFTNMPMSESTSGGLEVEGEDQVVVGVAVSWGSKDAYYVSFKEHVQSDDSQCESAVDTNLTLAHRVNALEKVVQFLTENGRSMICFDVKEHFKVRERKNRFELCLTK